MEIREVSALAAKIKNNIEKVMVGKSEEIELIKQYYLYVVKF